MIRNYFKIAWRNLNRRKGHALINIGGLAVGIAVCLLIFIMVQFELSFDNYHEKKDRIYRVLTEMHHAAVPEPNTNNGVPYPLPLTLQTAIPQIEESSVVYSVNGSQFQILDEEGKTVKKFKEENGVLFTEPSLFDIFDFEWLAGNPNSLKDPFSVVLTKETADKYFGDWKNAMGKRLMANNSETFTVTGILGSIPKNTDFQFKVVISYGTGFTSELLASEDWDSINGNFNCYVLLPPNVSEQEINAQLDLLSKEKRDSGNADTQILQPLQAVHFDTESGNFSRKSISYGLINVLWIVAGFILLIACVNFINLSTAQTANRSKEIGVRKVLGSNKSHLKMQFLIETFLIVLLSVGLAMAIAFTSLKYVGGMFDLPLSTDMIDMTQILLFLTAVTILVTLLAGFYPSVVLARYSAVDALKGKVAKVGSGSISLRRSLVVFQFVVAQALIIGTLILVNQMDYFMNQPLGFEKESIVNIALPSDSTALTKMDYLRNEILSINGVLNASYSSNTPLDHNRTHWSNFTFNQSTEDTEFYSVIKRTDHNFIDTYKLTLVAGRGLKPLENTTEFLVNETLLKKLGIMNSEEALNKEIDLWEGAITGPIVGVVKDFQSHSFKDEIAPVLMMPAEDTYGQIGLKLASAETSAALMKIEKTWNRLFPDYVFEYNFLDAKIAGYYEQEKRLSQLYTLAAGIAIFLSCLGLLGLASFMIMQRVKEAGIRKVLGATKNNIIYLFSIEFILLIGIAFCIAAPLAWYFMSIWLEAYTYRIDITWTVFVIGGLGTMCVALSTVGYQALKVARQNPVKSLRTE